MRRLAATLGVLALLVAAPAGAVEPKSARSWAAAEIRLVVANGLMAADVPSFRPDDPLTRGELAGLVAGLTGAEQPVPAEPDRPVTLAELDARLVRTLGLDDAAFAFRRSAQAAGLAPPGRFGSEVVTRLLGLRRNHPAIRDDLELHPNEPATRAEAAYSAARVLGLGEWETASAREAAASFSLPELTALQRRILGTAFGLVGFPYVWGGESERTERGFDCSGFVWRVYERAAPAARAALRGRTSYAMSGEVPRLLRIPFASLEPGDVVFFGANGTRSKPAQVDHMGIYAGGGWIVHSSRYGVTLAPLAGWQRERFAWGRRPLAEAGLASGPYPSNKA